MSEPSRRKPLTSRLPMLEARIMRTFASTEAVVLKALRRPFLWRYLRSDRRPWSAGYGDHRLIELARVLRDPELMSVFRSGRPLPARYGWRLDSRIVEIPWVLSRLRPEPTLLLDAGSSLNHREVLATDVLRRKQLTILTLAPEKRSHPELGVSYVFTDLRRTTLRDGIFDEIVCISTLEHVGMDNSLYTRSTQRSGDLASDDYVAAVGELHRMLADGGTLYLTIPYGRYENHGWLQQFDDPRVETILRTFSARTTTEAVFRYDDSGWHLSDRESCKDSTYFDVQKSKYVDPDSTLDFPDDFVAAERSVLCLALTK